jgi:hypothetical protein
MLEEQYGQADDARLQVGEISVSAPGSKIGVQLLEQQIFCAQS